MRYDTGSNFRFLPRDPILRSASTSTLPAHPPKPRLAFRVGVAGHRGDRLASADPELLKNRFSEIFAVLRRTVEEFRAGHHELFSDQPSELRALTPLAEGADRLFAAAALDTGLALCCPFPFSQAEFERDFVAPVSRQPGSLDEFRALLDRAGRESHLSCFEMDGDATARPMAYGACGQLVVHQSDILCVVWDGERRQFIGGTEHALDYAVRRSVPVVWIDARAPHDWQVIHTLADIPQAGETPARPAVRQASAELRRAVLTALELPTAAGGSHAEDLRSPGIEGFYGERWPRRTTGLGLAWRAFNRVLGYRPGRDPASVARGPQRPEKASGEATEVMGRLDAFLEWPDRLAVSYANMYRGSFFAAYMLAAAAVGMALLPLALGWNVFEPHALELLFIVAELAMITSILVIVQRGRARGWHERWLDYRLAAEFLRQVRFVAPIGGSRALPPRRWHAATYGSVESTWMSWYAHAVHRDIGLPSSSLDRPHLTAWIKDVLTMLTEQSRYHLATADGSDRVEHRLHLIGIVLLSITLLAGALHFLGALEPFSMVPTAPMIGSLIFICGFLPAFGAALAGIANQAEFRRVAKRSRALHLHFEGLASRMREVLAEVEAVADPPARPHQASVEAAAIALRATEHMINEVLDWRVVFIDRPLNPPA